MTDERMEAQGRGMKHEGPHVLIISYHFPPLNVISSFRPEAFARYLPRHGIRTTVLTLRWEPGTDGYTWHPLGSPCVIEQDGDERVIRLPRVRTFLQRAIDQALRVPLLASLTTAAAQCLGFFNLHVLYVHLAFQRYLREHLRTERYDAVIATMGPDEHIRLGAWVHRRTGTPFIADYRDTYDNRMLQPDFQPGVPVRSSWWFKRLYHERWIGHASLLTSTSSMWATHIASLTGARHILEVRNGYDPAKVLPGPEAVDSERFLITYAGRIYPYQDPGPFAEAMLLFTRMLGEEERRLVKVRFYGVQDTGHAAFLRRTLGDKLAEVHVARIPNASIYARIAESSILVLFDIRTPGAYTGKFLDYVGCGRHILMVPSDEGVIAELIAKGRLGLATGDPAAAAAFLHERFLEWRTHGRPLFTGDEQVIREASRTEQVARLANVLKQFGDARWRTVTETTGER